MPTLITFDLDDCLVNTSSALQQAGNTLYPQAFNLPMAEIRTSREHIYKTTGCLITHYAQKLDKPQSWIEDLYIQMAKGIIAHLPTHVPPCPLKPELLSQLQAQNIHLAVITQGRKDYAHSVLTHMGLNHFFPNTLVLGRDCVSGATKRTPTPYNALLQRLASQNIHPTQKYMLEDSPLNLQPAKALGFHTILIGAQPHIKDNTTPINHHFPWINAHHPTSNHFLQTFLQTHQAA